MTIPRYSDHAANERTFLAWVRTGIAIMAFGFLVERFNIFLKMAATSLHQGTPPGIGEGFGRAAGIILILAGAATIFLSAYRFRKTAHAIDSEDQVATPGLKADFSLGLTLVILGVALVVYLIHTLN
jgi:putative membrane protein